MDRKTRSSVIWRDIVFINGEYFLEEFPVVFENPVMNSLKFSDDEEEILNMFITTRNTKKPLELILVTDTGNSKGKLLGLITEFDVFNYTIE